MPQRTVRKPSPRERSPEELRLLDELRSVYATVDRLLEGWSCEASTDCCRFGVTGREPYPSAIELAELERGLRARGGLPKRRTLPIASERRCTLLSDEGRCLVYGARPFGCRTFFCERATPALGGPRPKELRDELGRLGRVLTDLSARFAPSDPGPRPLSRWTQSHEPTDRSPKPKGHKSR